MQNLCEPGYYCPAGSPSPIPCTAGKYCSGYGQAAESGDCEAGYICVGKATKPNPDDNGVTGYQCPKGQYCPAGATTGTKCPSGKYNDKEGASDDTYCLDCPANKQCVGEGLTSPDTYCPGGYYCTTSGGTLVQTLCEAGYKCPANELAKKRCLPGTYQPNTG